MAIANTAIYGNSLDGDMNEIFFDGYMVYPSEYDQVAKIQNITRGNHWKESELSPLGEIREIPQGTGVQFDKPEQGHSKTVYYTKYGLGFQITEEMMSDGLFGNFKQMPSKLAKSAAYKRETTFWDLFISGTTLTAWDSVAIFSASHSTLKSGTTVGNRPSTDGALSTTTLQAAFEYFDGLVDEAGMPLVMHPKWLIVPTELRWTAQELWRTSGKVDSADNNINTINPANMPESWVPFVSRHLTDSNDWFLLAKEHDFRFMWRDNIRMQSSDDFYTGNALFKVTGRWVCEVFDYKGGYGNFPS
jgi:phage major head subunit gpT-like protein